MQQPAREQQYRPKENRTGQNTTEKDKKKWKMQGAIEHAAPNREGARCCLWFNKGETSDDRSSTKMTG